VGPYSKGDDPTATIGTDLTNLLAAPTLDPTQPNTLSYQTPPPRFGAPLSPFNPCPLLGNSH